MSAPEHVLVEHTEWVRRLALRLVGDPHDADDLTQRTILAATRARVAVRDPRSWLASVLRNFVRQDRRADDRRQRRERLAAKPEAVPSTLELVERLALQRRIARLVGELDEPYRSVILLRFLEGLSVSEIAEHSGVSPSTVSTRVSRALERLRARLDREHGDRRAWASVLVGPTVGVAVPSAPSSGAASIPLIGALIVKTKLTWIVCTAVVAGVALLVADRFGGSALADVPPASSAVAHRDAAPGSSEVAIADEAPERQAVDSVQASETAREDLVDPLPIFGRVVDVGGGAVADVELRLAGHGAGASGAPIARSDGEGRFELPLPDASRSIVVASEDWSTVMAALIGPGTDVRSVEPVVIVAPRIRLAGSVVDERGREIAGARIAVVWPDDLRARLGGVLDHSFEQELRCRSDAAGRFALGDVGVVAGACVRASADGFIPREVPVPSSSTDTLRLELARPTPVDGALLGIVFDHRGRPAAGAQVALGHAEAKTGDDGTFALLLERAGGARTLRAMRRGSTPAERRVDEAADDGFVTLELGPPPLSIAGRVFGPDGRALEGAKVWAADPLPFGAVGGSFVSVEGYLGGGLTMDDLYARFVVDGQPIAPISKILDEHATAAWGWVRTGADGGFRIDGLRDRQYRLAVLVPRSLLRWEVGPFPAGAEDLRIDLPARPVHEVVAGQIVSKGGVPLEGLRVAVQCDPVRLAAEAGGFSTTHAGGTSAETDAEGRFRIEGVAADGAYLRIDGDRIVPLEYGRDVDGGITAVEGFSPDALRIAVSVRVHVRVVLVDPDEADAVAALDGEGRPLPVNVFTGNGRTTTMSVPLEGGRSPTLAVLEDVRALRLLRGQEEVRTVPVTLDPDATNELRL